MATFNQTLAAQIAASSSQQGPYRILYDYSSVPTIRRFALDDHRIRGIMGPFGSGKSSGCVMDILRRAHQQVPAADGIRRTRAVVIRNTYRQLLDTTIKTFCDWLPPYYFGEYKVTENTYYVTAFPNVYLEVLFRALDRPEHVSNLLSLEVSFAWINEAREIDESIFTALDGRIGRYPSKREGGCGWEGIMMDTNPPDENSWWYKYFEEKKPENATIFKQPSGLSPFAENLPNLPRNYYKNLSLGKDEMFNRVYVHGQYGYIIEGKPVHFSYNDNRHVAPHVLTPLKGFPLILGFDFGLTPSVVICQLTPRGQFLVLDELMSESMGLRQFCLNQLIPMLRQKYFGMKIMGFGDPAGTQRSPTDESTCYDILSSSEVGLGNIEAAPTNNSIARIGAVDQFLNSSSDGEPALVVSPNCKLLRKGLSGGYHFKRLAGSSTLFSDSPDKGFYSHLADALQYACMFAQDSSDRDRRSRDLLNRISRSSGYAPAQSLAGY